nr:hypothetical protein [Bacillaceae bacterium]
MKRLAGKAADRLARARLAASGGRAGLWPERPLSRKRWPPGFRFCSLAIDVGPRRLAFRPPIRKRSLGPPGAASPFSFGQKKIPPHPATNRPGCGLIALACIRFRGPENSNKNENVPPDRRNVFFRNRTVPGSAADFYKASEMPRIRIPNSTQAMTR